ncbi:MAG: methylated-DNA--[protein]-cysteine S-methyltransferase [Nibricoccus sp.]
MSENGERASQKWSIMRTVETTLLQQTNLRKREMTYFYKEMKSPVGLLKLVAGAEGLAAILWENDDPKRVRLSPLEENENHPTLLEAERQLTDYFAGKLERFSVKLAFAGGTAFQKQVWTALTTIPFGETRSYAEIARQIGSPKAVRAVGAANGRNPISIIAPCHRVIGANGKLTGFAGGLETKAFLLKLEAKDEPSESGEQFQLQSLGGDGDD